MTDTADPQRRVDPPLRAGEAGTLLAFLDYHRDTLRMKVAGLDREQLGRTLPPSTMTLGGLVKHLTLVEENWFSVVLEGNPFDEPWASVDWDGDPDWEWRTGSTDQPEALLAAYERTVARVDQMIRAALERGGPDSLSAKESRHGEGAFSLRWILLHMIEEYARHNGHADLLRESIDGEVGE
ncbi:MAG TPA: DinB family protein [Marmoricola sp.]|nr:DinB family protein [Marmoricola sp.]